jgi:hypothetical protein
MAPEIGLSLRRITLRDTWMQRMLCWDTVHQGVTACPPLRMSTQQPDRERATCHI